MNITEDQYICLHSIAIQMIEFDIKNGIEIKVVNINYYIDRAMKSLMLQCDDDVRLRLFADIEYRYNISHERGSAIFNDYDNKREWYAKMQIDNPYFWMRYKEYLINNTTVSPRSINLLDEETLPDIMNCLGNPNKEFNGKSFRRGLIIGDVQSGKTATYTGLICKAADAGYKVVILLAGITESLRRQTQKRIDEGIVGITVSKDGKKINKERIGVGLDNKTLRATSFTSRASDFVGNYDKIAMSLNTNNSLVLFVVKKNVSILQKLYKWLKEQNIDSVKGYVDEPMLLIDDEADNASVNTNKYETDPTKTNKLIRQICTLFKNSSYVGFTATPFANVFIDPDSVDSMQNADLFPEHFIYALESPSNYVGSKQIFYPEGKYYSNLRYITDIQEPDYTSDEYKEDSKYALDELNSGTFYYRHSKDWDGILPDSLEDAVMCFFLVNAIRDLRGQKSSHRSMLVNMSRFINVQRIIAEHIEQIFDKTFNEIRFNFGETISENEKLPLCQKLFSIWQKHFSHIHDIDFADIVKKSVLIEAIEKIKVLVINGSKQSGKLDYSDKSKPLRVIAVGGLALSRGLTLEGLIISYFYRNSATFDVLMQMGRWFGYREGYEDLFQIWTSKTSAQWYAEVARASHELKDDIRNMFEQRLTPKDFGIKVYDNCRDLQITASNKMRTAKGIEMQYSFYGNIYDTPYITYNVEHNRHNLQQIENLAGKLFTNGYRFVFADLKKESKDVNDKGDGSSRLFADVPKEVVLEFVKQIKWSMANPNFDCDNIVKFLSDGNNIGLDKWDVVFEGGDSEDKYNIKGLEYVNCMKRAICDSNKNVVQLSTRRRVLSGSSEGRYGLTEEQIRKVEYGYTKGSNIPLKKYFEKLPDRKPVFVIMLIKPNAPTEDEPEKLTKFRQELGGNPIAAFAIGCPGVTEAGEPIKYKVNKIYQRLNIEGLEPEEVDDEE